MLTADQIKKFRLRQYTYHTLSDVDVHAPVLPSILGAFLQEAFPDVLQKTSKRFLTTNVGGWDGRPFYGFNLGSHTHAQICPSEEEFQRHRYHKPTKISCFIRQGAPNAYYDYLSKLSLHLLPCLNFFHAFGKEDLEPIYEHTNLLLEERRPIIVFCNQKQAQAILATHRVSVRTHVTFEDMLLRSNNIARIQDEKDLLLKPHTMRKSVKAQFGFENLHMLVLGTGYNIYEHTLNDPFKTAQALKDWNQVFRSIRVNVLEATFGAKQLDAHQDAFKTVVDKGDSVLPPLNILPVAEAKDLLEVRPIHLSRSLKVKSNGLTSALLNYDEETLRLYNPTEGRDTGVRSAALSKANLLLHGLNNDILGNLGYDVSITPDVQDTLAKKNVHYRKQMVPLNPVSDSELLAYFKPGFYECRATVRNPATGAIIWEKGEHYHINPGWTTQSYDGGEEPILDEARDVIGVDRYTIKYSVLELNVETSKGTIQILENECRDDIEEGEEGPRSTEWCPVLDEFVIAFSLPQVKTVWEEFPAEMKRNLAKLAKRMPQLKGYQAEMAAANAIKHGAILGSEMGAGKTFQALALIYLKQKSFNLIVVPPTLLSQWIKACKLNGFWARPLMSHKAVGKIQRRYKRMQRKTPEEKRRMMLAEQEVYITTPEFLALGDLGNRVYEPWTAVYHKADKWEKDEDTKERYREEIQYEIEATRYHARNEAHALHRSLNRAHRYAAHVKTCPKCGANHEEGFSRNGYCNNLIEDNHGRRNACGYRAYGYRGNLYSIYVTPSGKRIPGKQVVFGSAPIPEGATVERAHAPKAEKPVTYKEVHQTRTAGKRRSEDLIQVHKTENFILDKVHQKSHSDHSYPAAKRLGKIFGLKVIDEVHDLANMSTQKGRAVRRIHADETLVMSGTLSRGYVTDIESALAQIHSAYTPSFPFPTWEHSAFREQFVTTRVKKSVLSSGGTKSSTSAVPEASNITRLRRMLNCNITMASESVIEAEWKLPPLRRTYAPVTLSASSLDYYHQVLADVVEWYKYASSKEIQRNAMSKLWELRHICEGPEKVEVIADYIRKWYHEGHKFVITAPTKALYLELRDVLDGFGIRYLSVDEHVSPDKREEVTSHFSQPGIRCLLSRPKLICLGLNTLVHANKLLIGGPEYQPATVRQMEKRLVRPGQLADEVEVVYPTVRNRPKMSVEEEMLRLLLKKETAVNEVLKGKVRWAKPAMLIASALEKQGAVRVLQALVEEESEKDTHEVDLDALFESSETFKPVASNSPTAADVLESMDLDDFGQTVGGMEDVELGEALIGNPSSDEIGESREAKANTANTKKTKDPSISDTRMEVEELEI